jgi:stalled ribosome rescue protein Dom34
MQILKSNKMKQTGIWLDKEKAIIVNLNNGSVNMNTIVSNVETFHVGGGSGTRLKGGPQDVVQDSKYLEREKHQLKKYFKNIVSEIKNEDAIVLLGPAETRDQFNKELKTSYKNISTKIKDVVKVDNMTKNQLIAWVKRFFQPIS